MRKYDGSDNLFFLDSSEVVALALPPGEELYDRELLADKVLQQRTALVALLGPSPLETVRTEQRLREVTVCLGWLSTIDNIGLNLSGQTVDSGIASACEDMLKE